VAFKKYSGNTLTVLYDLKRCIHAAECVHGLPAVFDPEKRPWIQPDNASAEDLETVVASCPSGALRIAGTEPAGEKQIAETSVLVGKDGPLYLHGHVELSTGDDRQQKEERVALCRCGASNNKPFCDNRHLQVDFQAASCVESRGEGTAQANRLKVRTVPDGPLLVQGSFVISGEESEGAYRAQNAALCRCGASSRKPFCDGQHKAIGFKA